MKYTVVYDANVLYPSVLRDVLIRVAQKGLVRARWSNLILDEVFRNLRANRPDLDPVKLDRTRQLMCAAVPDCLVLGYEKLTAAIELPDPDDRHILAAAIRAGAQTIVTANLRDFPPDTLREWDIEAKSPDAFLQDIYHIDGALTHQAVSEAAAARRNPYTTVGEIVDALDRLGLPVAASLLRC